MTALERGVQLLAEVFDAQQVPYMVIGGVANLVWGQPRATLDVDASVMVEESRWKELLEPFRRHFHLLPRQPLKFLRETHVLPMETSDRIRIDVIWARLPYEQEAILRAVSEDVGGRRVRICRPEDLIIHKAVAGRSKDREDIRQIIRRQGRRLDYRAMRRTLQELARALDQPEVVTFVDDCFRDIMR